MVRVKVTRKIVIRKKTVTLRKQTSIGTIVKDAAIEATGIQLKIMAEETREMILDRIFAGIITPPGNKVVERPRRTRRVDTPTAKRGPLPHAPLKQGTVESKARAKADGRPLIETGALMNAVEIFEGKQRGVKLYKVRMRAGQHRGNPSLDNTKLMRLHEFGSASAKVPARPTWRPVIGSIRGYWQGTKFKRFLKAKSLRTALRGIS